MAKERIQAKKSPKKQEAEVEVVTDLSPTKRPATLVATVPDPINLSETDDLLDEIDTILEETAVQATYRQRGGE